MLTNSIGVATFSDSQRIPLKTLASVLGNYIKDHIKDISISIGKLHTAGCLPAYNNTIHNRYVNMGGQGSSSPTDRQQALLDGISLGLGEHAALGDPVDRLEQGVHQLAVGLGASEQRRTLGEEGQHCCAQIAVESQRHVSACQIRLRGRGGGGGGRDASEGRRRETEKAI